MYLTKDRLKNLSTDTESLIEESDDGDTVSLNKRMVSQCFQIAHKLKFSDHVLA